MRELEKPTHSARTDPTMKATTMDSYDGGERMVDTGSLGQRKKKATKRGFHAFLSFAVWHWLTSRFYSFIFFAKRAWSEAFLGWFRAE